MRSSDVGRFMIVSMSCTPLIFSLLVISCGKDAKQPEGEGGRACVVIRVSNASRRRSSSCADDDVRIEMLRILSSSVGDRKVNVNVRVR